MVEAHWNPAALDEAVAFARESGSAQLVVYEGDNCLLNEEFSPDPVDVYAVQKGLVALLIGKAQQDFLLETSDPVNHHLDPEWTGLGPWDEAKLTIETLLTMTTGMDDELKPLGEIGRSWRYNNTAYQYLKKILCQHTGLSLQALSEQWLLSPLGMQQTTWEDRAVTIPDGTPISGLMSTARDLAQIGRLVLGRGSFEGNKLLTEDFFFDQLVAPGSEENPAWGFLWWNNRGSHYPIPMREETVVQGPIIPSAPDDLIAARGALQNHLSVSPSLNLVVARTTLMPAKGKRPAGFEDQFWQLLMAARD